MPPRREYSFMQTAKVKGGFHDGELVHVLDFAFEKSEWWKRDRNVYLARLVRWPEEERWFYVEELEPLPPDNGSGRTWS